MVDTEPIISVIYIFISKKCWKALIKIVYYCLPIDLYFVTLTDYKG
ncbi:hypothetical protein VCHA37O177_30228 [Vibrio chagasii]|nr:hypothetical protein VCHA37O177_30228 [Vibrio chagasii]